MNINENAKNILLTLKRHGHDAVLAGGCVRDYILGIEPYDWDIATSATPNTIAEIFPKSIPVGKYFGVMTVLEGGEAFEVATFRTDGEYKDGRKPSSVSFSSMKEDAQRRDLTINGMFYDLDLGVIDYVGGQVDLQAHIIQFIGFAEDRIKEDHLRIMRAVRFSLRLGFGIEQSAMESIKRNAHLLKKISSERIRDELDKIFSTGKYREALELLSDTGILKYILPEVEAYRGCAQNPKWHPEGDVWEHTMCVLDNLPEKATKEMVWGALFHDVGKPASSEEDDDGTIRSPMHEKIGMEITRLVLFKLKFPNSFIDSICYIVGNHMKIAYAEDMRVSKVKTLLSHPNASDLLAVAYADSMGSTGDIEWFKYIQSHIEQWKKEELQPKPLLSGRDLIDMGLKPSPQFGEILQIVYNEQMDMSILTKEDAVERARKLISLLDEVSK